MEDPGKICSYDLRTSKAVSSRLKGLSATAAGLALFVAPRVVADVNTVIVFDPFAAHVAVIFFSSSKRGSWK